MAGSLPTGTVRLVRWRLLVVDGLVAAAAFGASATILAASAPLAAGEREPDAAAYLLVGVCSAAVVGRRRAPAVATVAAAAASLGFAAAYYPVALTPVVLLPMYTAAAELPPRRARLLLAITFVLVTIGATLGPGPTDASAPAVLVSAWLLGNYVGSRRTYTADLEAKNRQLEQAQAELAARAVGEERLRIARELHDVVAHTMSVVAVHAGTGRMVAEEDPAAARLALATIETATRSALAEMRRLLGVLRSAGDGPAEGLGPAPGLGDLDGLVTDVARSGVTVEVLVEGHRDDVPAGVDLSAYRIVQEALTNVLKHVGRARATVTVRYGDGEVTVEVEDDGPVSAPVLRPDDAGGHGLAGMRERVALYAGDLEVGSLPGGGFRVSARLPYRVQQ